MAEPYVPESALVMDTTKISSEPSNAFSHAAGAGQAVPDFPLYAAR